MNKRKKGGKPENHMDAKQHATGKPMGGSRL